MGRPFKVNRFSKEKKEWELREGKTLPVHASWEMFNRSFHDWFVKDVPESLSQNRKKIVGETLKLHLTSSVEAMKDHLRLHLWNYVHRIQDGIWDPRGNGSCSRGWMCSNRKSCSWVLPKGMRRCSWPPCTREAAS
ncbi:hypothetical protein ACPJHQ_12170 [Rossellomorea sp. H39__3]